MLIEDLDKLAFMKWSKVARWFFVLMSVGFIAFCWWNFRAFMRTSSDPFSVMPEDAKWVWVIQDWQEVSQQATTQLEWPIYSRLKADMSLWNEWSANYADIQQLIQSDNVIWVSQDSLMNKGVWCFGIPDSWSTKRIDQLCQRVPNLIRKGDGLVWSIDGSGTAYENICSEESLAIWNRDYETIDHAASIAVLGKNARCRFALENRMGDWWGYLVANQDLLGTSPLDTLLPLRAGSWCEAAYIRNIPSHLNDSALKVNAQSFTIDTMCQCNAWQTMLEGQQLVGSIHFSGANGVSFGQGYQHNPLIEFESIFSDTSKSMLPLKHPAFFRNAVFPEINTAWSWMFKRNNRLTFSNDSTLLRSLVSDTTYFEDLRFEHSFPNHPVLLGYHRTAKPSAMMPIDWSLIKGNKSYSIQAYAAGVNRWVIQLNQVR
jgi:hypothetical protein